MSLASGAAAAAEIQHSQRLFGSAYLQYTHLHTHTHTHTCIINRESRQTLWKRLIDSHPFNKNDDNLSLHLLYLSVLDDRPGESGGWIHTGTQNTSSSLQDSLSNFRATSSPSALTLSYAGRWVKMENS